MASLKDKTPVMRKYKAFSDHDKRSINVSVANSAFVMGNTTSVKKRYIEALVALDISITKLLFHNAAILRTVPVVLRGKMRVYRGEQSHRDKRSRTNVPLW